jgi:hypothetical protein
MVAAEPTFWRRIERLLLLFATGMVGLFVWDL